MVPDAAKRSFFYGVNFELGYEMPRFASNPWGLEIRPIVGVRNAQWEFIVNPIVDLSFGAGGEADFAPALRLARNLGNDWYVGLEYYGDYGKIGDFLPLQQQSQQLFAVTDFKAGVVDVELGVGYGFTPDRTGSWPRRSSVTHSRCPAKAAAAIRRRSSAWGRRRDRRRTPGA